LAAEAKIARKVRFRAVQKAFWLADTRELISSLHPLNRGNLTRKEPSKFEMVVRSADSAYFVHGQSRGLVFGPKKSGREDHITVGFNDGEFSQAHRKINGREDWRVTPEYFQAETDSLVANNVKSVEFASLRRPGTYIISFNRIRVLFAAPQALVSIVMPLLWRMIATKKVVRSAAGQRVELTVEERKLRRLIARSSGPLSILGKLLKHLPPRVPLQILRLIARWALVRPQTSDRLEDDVFFVVSKDYAGLLWRGESGLLQYLPVAPLLELYGRAERMLPFGKLSELGTGWTGDITLIGRVW
jgi:hypothetical protein